MERGICPILPLLFSILQLMLTILIRAKNWFKILNRLSKNVRKPQAAGRIFWLTPVTSWSWDDSVEVFIYVEPTLLNLTPTRNSIVCACARFKELKARFHDYEVKRNVLQCSGRLSLRQMPRVLCVYHGSCKIINETPSFVETPRTAHPWIFDWLSISNE